MSESQAVILGVGGLELTAEERALYRDQQPWGFILFARNLSPEPQQIIEQHPDIVIVYERDGTFVTSWGEGIFGNTHGITIGPDDTVWVTDNRDSVVRQLSPKGELLQTLGTPGQPTDTGYDTKGKPEIHHNETVVRSAGPFNSCCNMAFGPNGDFYVADGYGNARDRPAGQQRHQHTDR